MLFVGDGKPEAVENDIALYQCRGADGDLYPAAFKPRLGGSLLSRSELARKESDVYSERRQHRGECFAVLFGKYLGGRHHDSLTAVSDGKVYRGGGDDGLTAADIALHQSEHGYRALHIREDLFYHALLCAGQ